MKPAQRGFAVRCATGHGRGDASSRLRRAHQAAAELARRRDERRRLLPRRHAAPRLVPMAQAVAGTALVAGGAAVLNQVYERDTDALMRRTRMRPLPDGRVATDEAGMFGLRARRRPASRCWLSRPTCSPRVLAARHARRLPDRLHADEAPLAAGDAGRRRARRAAAAHRLDRGARLDRRPAVGAVRDRVPLADSALHGDRVAVPRRLRQGGLPDAAGHRAGRRRTGRQAVCTRPRSLPVSLVPDARRHQRPIYFGVALLLGVALLVLAVRFARDAHRCARRARCSSGRSRTCRSSGSR